MDNINDLITKFKNGDETIFKKILEANIKLITITAKKYRCFFSNLKLDELISEGTYGLLQAVKHYDIKKDVQFQTYAQYWIKKYVRDYAISSYTIVKTPYNVLKNIKKILGFIEADKYISSKEISKKLKLDHEKVKDLLTGAITTKREVSLDSFLDRDDEQETVYDVIPGASEQIEEDANQQQEEEKKHISSMLDKLEPKEAEIIKWRFGIVDHKHHTAKSVAKKMNLSAQKVREIEEMAMVRLKMMVKNGEDISGR